jgi:hypothetical protein
MSNQKTWERQQFEKEEMKKYGVVTYSRKSEEYRSDVVVIPTEIDSFTKSEIINEYGRTYTKWIQECYLLRLREILTNPTEFGKVGIGRQEE